MSLTVGLATGLWTFSFKTLQAWRRFLCCRQCQAPLQQKYTAATAIIHYNESVNEQYGQQTQVLLTTRPLSEAPYSMSLKHPPSELPPPPPSISSSNQYHQYVQQSGYRPGAGHYVPLSMMSSDPCHAPGGSGRRGSVGGSMFAATYMDQQWKN
jgi:hypothetical protein